MVAAGSRIIRNLRDPAGGRRTRPRRADCRPADRRGSRNQLYQGDEGIFAWLVEVRPKSISRSISTRSTRCSVAPSSLPQQARPRHTFGIETGGPLHGEPVRGGARCGRRGRRESVRWKRYDPGEPEEAAWKLSLLSRSTAAIDAGDLWVAYQPKFRLPNRQIVGAEALVRWTHPEKGAIGPMEFIPAAEQSGRIEKLTEFVLDRAIRAAAVINRRSADFTMSVNISPKLLGRFPLESVVMELLARYRLPSERLMLEVTETARPGRRGRSRAASHLREQGVHISIDDYGTGLLHARLYQAHSRFEDQDRQELRASHRQEQQRPLMVSSTIQLAHSLGVKLWPKGLRSAHFRDTDGHGVRPGARSMVAT